MSAENDKAQAYVSAEPGFRTMLQRSITWVAQHELWLLIVASPFFLFPSRWTWGALFLILLPWLSRWISTGKPTLSTLGDAPILLLLCMAVVGVAVSPEPARSLAALWRIVLGVAVFYGLVNGLQSADRLERLPAALILGSLLLTLLTLVGTGWDAVRLFRLPQVYERLPHLLRDLQDQNPFHPRVMGMALATIWPVPMALLLFASSKRYQLWAGIAVLVMSLTILLTQSLQAAVGVAGALLFLGMCWNRWMLCSVPLMLGMLLIALRFAHPQQIASMLLSPADPLGIAVTLRLDIWSRALAMIQDLPYTGVGLDMFPVIQSNFYPGVMIGPEPHAHQLFLQIAVDLGLPGLLAFLWLLASLSIAAVKTYQHCPNAPQRAILLGAIGGVVSFIASGFLDTIWAAKPGVLLWFVLGLVAALYAACERRQQPVTRRASLARWSLPALLIVLALCLNSMITHRTPRLNWTVVQAHKLLLAAQAGENPPQQDLVSVATDLSKALPQQGNNPYLYSLLGRLYGWIGEYSAARDAFSKMVALDSQDALARYAPFEYLRRRFVEGEKHDPWADILWIYHNWMARFPQRAEPVLLVALVQEQHLGNLQGAVATLQSGIERGAQPQGLLLYC
ncbi:MAG: O-antigen ligase family protein, partial [Chloroflexi bacterium]|nr:O-antigen ligase family protein [Chloroflexota bacterium]